MIVAAIELNQSAPLVFPFVLTSVKFGQGRLIYPVFNGIELFGATNMSPPKIPHNAFVFVGDGRKALFLRNEGDEKYLNLKTERVFEDVNPLTHEQGSDRPGRVSKAFDSGQRSAIEQVDWHHIEEHRFAGMVATAMEKVVRERKVPALVVVAPPRTLAVLRGAFHDDVRARIIAEINKDLTRHPIGDIERQLSAA